MRILPRFLDPWQLLASVGLLTFGCATLVQMRSLPPVEEVIEYENNGYPMIVGTAGARVYQNHSTSSRVVKELPKGAVVSTLAEAGSQGNVAFYRVRTRSDVTGWCKRWDLDGTTTNAAELIVLRDKQWFEQALQDTILAAAHREIKAQSLHPLSRVQSTWITDQVNTSSASGYDVGVQAVMVGRILGRDTYQIDMNVNLFLQLNKDHLSASVFEVNRVRIVSDKQIEGMPLQKKVNIAKLLFTLIL